MGLAPINYGPEVQEDGSGVNAMRGAVAQHAQVFAQAEQLGSVVEGGSLRIAQGMLHTQSLKATAAVKERQANTLQFIDSNPYVPKAVLQQRMRPEDFEAWSAGLGPEYQDADKVPMFTAAGALFDSEAQQAREDAGKLIGLPGWRASWSATEQTESATIRERYVNRLAADQMIADQRGQAVVNIDRMAENAVKPEDIDAAMKAAGTNPWLKPAERKTIQEKLGVQRDSFAADNYMRAQDIDGMEKELVKLRADNAAELYPHMTEKQRLDLTNRLDREYNFYGAKTVADRAIVGPAIDPESGKVDSVKVAKALAAYNGPNKPEVEKAVKTQESEAIDVFNKSMSALQQKVWTAGQNQAGDFSMERARQDPEARSIIANLNKNAPNLLTALNGLDLRRQRILDMKDREEREQAKRDAVDTSHEALRSTVARIDDPKNSDELRNLTPEQFNSQLLNLNLQKPDMDAAQHYFEHFLKNGGKPDERPAQIVSSELNSAAGGDVSKYRKLKAKYEDVLRAKVHEVIRANPTLPPDKLDDVARTTIKREMLKGSVVGSSSWFPDSKTPRVDWETNPRWRGMPLKLEDGTVVDPGEQLVRVSNGRETLMIRAADAQEAAKDGYK